MKLLLRGSYILIIIIFFIIERSIQKSNEEKAIESNVYKRFRRNLLKQDFQLLDLEYSPRWKFNMSTRPKLYMKLQYESLTLKCDAIGRPKPTILWFKDSQPLPLTDHASKYKKFGYRLKIIDLISIYDEGNYTCIVKNRHGQLAFTYIVDVVVRYADKPEFTEIPRNRTLFEGERIHLSFGYYSDMEAYVYWLKHYQVNGSYFDSNGNGYTVILQRFNMSDEIDETEWIVENSTLSDAGLYSCCVKNIYGVNCRQAFVNVIPGRRNNGRKPEELLTGSDRALSVILPVSIGGILLLLLFMAFIFVALIWKNRRKKYGPIRFKDHPVVFNPIYTNVIQTALKEIIRIPTIDEKWEIPEENLKIGRLLGQGAFGKVYFGQLSSSTWNNKSDLKTQQSTDVAVKMLRDNPTEDDVRLLIKEIELMKNIGRHTNVIEFRGCCTQNGHLEMVVEYARYGNLRDFLRDRCLTGTSRQSMMITDRPMITTTTTTTTTTMTTTGGLQSTKLGGQGDASHSISSKELISFAYQVARGLDFLASKNVVHRDIACRNVLLTEDFVVKIADFGLTRVLDRLHPYYYPRQSADLLPIRWMSPESLNGRRPIFTTKSDVWSYGILLWEIFSFGEVPYNSIPVENLQNLLINGHRLEKPTSATADIYRVMVDCWRSVSATRPSFLQLVSRLETQLLQFSTAEYLPLDGRSETVSLSDEEVFEQQLSTPDVSTAGCQTAEGATVGSACRSIDSQYSSWSSDQTKDNNNSQLLAQVHQVVHPLHETSNICHLLDDPCHVIRTPVTVSQNKPEADSKNDRV